MIILAFVVAAAVMTVMLGRRDSRALLRVGVGAVATGVVVSGVALLSGEWLLFYIVVLAAVYGFSVLLGRFMLVVCLRRNGVGVAPASD